MKRLAAILRHANITERPEARDGEALYWNVLAQCFIAIPTPSRQDERLLRRHGWEKVEGASHTLQKTAVHPWLKDDSQPLYLASSTNQSAAFLISGNEREGYVLMTFFEGIPGIHQRKASTIAGLVKPSPEWTDHEWKAYAVLLTASPTAEAAFWKLPTLDAQNAVRHHLLDTANDDFWRQQVTQHGLKALMGSSHHQNARRQFLDAPPSAWLDHMADEFDISLDERANLNLLLDLWMILRASDKSVREQILPSLRVEHPDTFATWDDGRLLALWRSTYNACVQHIRSIAAVPRQRHAAPSQQAAPLTPDTMRAVLSAHYGRPVIKALEQAGKLNLIATTEDLPQEIRLQAGVNLAYMAGLTTADSNVYLVANRLTAAQAPGIFLHEMGEHAGLEQMLGVWSREVMARIVFEGLRILMPLFQDKANRRTTFQRS